MSPDRRHWILDPAGHRRHWTQEAADRDGETVTIGGLEFVNVVPPAPEDDDDWVCDVCTTPILTRWGAEPFPVPMDGSYALCSDHFQTAQTQERSDGWGEPIPGTRRGVWPPQACTCPPCRVQFAVWERFIVYAYGVAALPAASLN